MRKGAEHRMWRAWVGKKQEKNGWETIRNFNDDILKYSVDRPTLSSDFALKLTWLLRVSLTGRGS